MRRNTNSIFVVCMIVFVMLACYTKAPKPYFTDRTSGWELSFDWEKYFSVIELKEKDDYPFFYCFLFQDSHLTSEVALPDSDMSPEQIMEYGLKLAFEDRYIDFGEDEIYISDYEQNGLRVYDAGSTRLILDINTNSIIQCIDARLQRQFEGTRFVETKGVIACHIDLSQLTSEDIQICNEYFTPVMEGGTYHFKQTDLPLTAEKAFEVTAEDIYNRYGDKPGGVGGGEYKVYDCEKSNCWLICGERFTQMLDKDTGNRMLLTWEVTDLSTKTGTQGDS